MSEYHFKHFYETGTRLTIKKNTIFYAPNDPGSEAYVFFLEKGLAALSSLTRDGEEKIYLYFMPKRLVGFNQFFSTLPYTIPIYITAKEPCVVYRLPGRTFRKLVAEDSEFNEYIMKLNACNYMDVLGRFHETQEESAGVRLCRLLLDYSRMDAGRQILPHYFTYAEISKFLGIHQVTVNRIMAKLKKHGYINNDLNTRHIIIQNRVGLELLIQSGMNFEY